ncbi:MAG TPA: cation diffusion facilitator family transporter [Chloroflexota bacterium]|nr:cation diffusion facilitator family transporter [Chloroflexota bacterium]
MSTSVKPAIESGAAVVRHDDAREREHRAAANRAVAVSAIGLALTGAIELGIALFTGSVALLGDALHNLSDVSTSLVVFLGFWISGRKPSPTHPYGYERAEDIAGLGIALVIFASAAFAAYESYLKLISDRGTSNLYVGMAAAVIGMAGNLAVSRYKRHVARQIRSVTMEAEANHSWLDMISSLGALIGLVGVALGYRWADPVAGFAVTLFILHVGWEVTTEILHHLMDGVDPEHLEAARQAASNVPDVQNVSVRGRWMGRSLTLELEGHLPGETPLARAEEIGQTVEAVVRNAGEEARHITWIPRQHAGGGGEGSFGGE